MIGNVTTIEICLINQLFDQQQTIKDKLLLLLFLTI